MKARFKRGIRRSNVPLVMARDLESVFRGLFITNVFPVTRRRRGREKRQVLVFAGNAIYGNRKRSFHQESIERFEHGGMT
jgi:hypothetical protein